MGEKTMTRRRSAAGAAHPEARANGHATPARRRGSERREASFNNVLERLSVGVAKESLNEEIGTSGALLRGAQALREMQLDASRRTQQAHERATEQLRSARNVAELGSVGLMLAQADAEGAVRYWTDMAGIVAKTGIEGWNEALGAWMRTQGLAQSFGQHWLETVASAKPETLEAQVEHATTPVTSSAFVWPAQEAVREAMTLGARNWNEWLGSTMPAAAKIVDAAAAAAAAATSPKP